LFSQYFSSIVHPLPAIARSSPFYQHSAAFFDVPPMAGAKRGRFAKVSKLGFGDLNPFSPGSSDDTMRQGIGFLTVPT